MLKQTRALNRSAALALTMLLGSGLAPSAYAQEASTPAATLDEITVTSSRVARAGFTAPTPMTVVGAEEFEEKAATHLRDVLYDLPMINPSPSGGSGSTNTGGQYVSMRNLGPSRTLTLVDGHRFVATNVAGNVDINVVPASLIERLEVVTGGASAAWGSDAVSGVVNVVLKKRFDGLQGILQYGRAAVGDNANISGSLAGGTSYADNRGTFMIAADYTRLDGLLNQDSREWGKRHWALLNNPAYTATNSEPRLLFTDNATLSTMNRGGLITAGPLKGTTFGVGGAPTTFVYGTAVGTLYQIGGSGDYIGGAWNIVTPLDRRNVFARTSFDVSDSLQFFAEASYARSHSAIDIVEKTDPASITIQRDNAFLPAATRQAMISANVTTFTMGRIETELLPDLEDVTNTTSRFAIGVNGTLPNNWKWSAYYQYGRNKYHLLLPNQRIEDNWLLAVDSVISPTTGKPICRSTLTAPNNGCIPANLFGLGSISADVLPYVLGTGDFTALNALHVVAFDIKGDIFSLRSGPVSVAAGLEHRKASLTGESDPISQARRFRLGNQQAISGENTVTEGYLEGVIPLLKDVPLAKSMELNGAIRYTNYSTSGGVRTWKVGLSYNPIDSLRLRSTRSRDIRAPSLNELYQSAQQGSGSVNDPFTNTTARGFFITKGNDLLRPEIADTFTAGVVFTPSWLPGFQSSIDYYNIGIVDAIGSFAAQATVDRCFTGNQVLCGNIIRVNGVINQVISQQQNVNKNNERGVDIELAHSINLGAGRLTTRAVGTHTIRSVLDDGVTAINRAGEIGRGWRWQGSTSYRLDKLTLSGDVRYLSKGNIDNTFTDKDLDLIERVIPAQYYFGASAQYVIAGAGRKELQIFGRVNNLLDRWPPMVPNNQAQNQHTDTSLYDVAGRSFSVGIRVKY